MRCGKKVTLYYHVGVVFYLIVNGFAVALDAEMMAPHEGEVPAALRLLPRVFQNHGRILDGVIGDAEYFGAPFFNLCTEHGKYAAAVLKDNNPALLAEARALMDQIEPTVQEGPAGRTLSWDIEGISINDNMKKPVRVLRVFEPARLPIRSSKRSKKQPEPEPHDNLWGTTAPKATLPTREFAQLGHHRWDIENCVFNILVNQWGLDHCYKHEPAAILNFILAIFIAYLLVQCFRSRNLKPELQRLFTTIIALADELRASLATATGRAPWIERASLPAP